MEGPLQLDPRATPRASVIIACRRQPRQLDLAIAAVLRQTRAPLEVFIADAGSGPRTHDVVEHWRGCATMPLHHLRPAAGGAGQTLALNEAIAAAQGDQLLFLDGGTFPHRSWLADHVARADGRSVFVGSGVRVGPKLSPEITRDDVEAGRFDGPLSPLLMGSRLAGDTKSIGPGLRLPRPIAWLLGRSPGSGTPLNVSLPRNACLGAGAGAGALRREASPRDIHAFEAELDRSGYRRRSLNRRGLVYILQSPAGPQAATAEQLRQSAAFSR